MKYKNYDFYGLIFTTILESELSNEWKPDIIDKANILQKDYEQ